MTTPTIGSWIHARWERTYLGTRPGQTYTSLYEISGTVRHVTEDRTVNPPIVRFYIESGDGYLCPECRIREVAVDPKHVVEVR